MKILTFTLPLFILLILTSPAIYSQQDNNNGLTHHMTPEEELRKDEIGRDFFPTDPPDRPVRMVAEFEQMQSVLIRYPLGIPYTLVEEMSQDCIVLTLVGNNAIKQEAITNYQNAGVNMANCEFLIAPTNSYWTRDYGPWFVVNGEQEVGVCNFPYNRPRPDDDDIPIVIANHLGIELYGMPLIHTGGNWMCDGYGRGASTTLVLDENPAISEDSVGSLVETYLGVDRYYTEEDPLGEYIEHIDCWGKFLDIDKVLIGQVPEWDPRYDDFEQAANNFSFRTSPYGNHYQVYRVFTPGTFPNTPYTNSLILNKKVLVPITGSEHDAAALQAYEAAMPGYEIVGIMHNTWENTDALHCRAKGIADIGMLHIKHFPLLGSQSFQLEWPVETGIIPYSSTGLKQDSLKLYYSVNSTAYEALDLVHESGQAYSATIPFQEPGSVVAYYLHAMDYSGRVAEHPYIGEPDPHVFEVAFAGDALADPDTLWFLTPEAVFDGLSFNIMNFTEGDLDLIYLEEFSHEGPIPFYVDPPPPMMPHLMAYGDTLTITVKIDQIVDNPAGLILTDTLNFTTENGPHHVILKLDEDLLASIAPPSMEEPLALNAVYPNPFNASTQISFTMEQASRVSADIYSIDGVKASTLVDTFLPAGSHKISWDGKDAGGNQLADGIYLLIITDGTSNYSKKLILMRGN
jgi:agmatine deiminase